MKKSNLTETDREILKSYGISSIDAKACCYLKYEAGETILRQGMEMEYLFMVRKGRAKVRIATREGKALTLCYYITGGIIGDIELMTNVYVSAATMTAITEFECIALPYQKCAKELKENVDFLNQAGEQLALKLLQSSRQYTQTTLYSGEERLATYLLKNSYQGIFCEPLTETAGCIGISYRHLLRIIKAFCSKGILSKRENGYYITDKKQLRELALERV